MPTLSEKLIKSLPAPASGSRIIFDDHRDAPKGFGLKLTKAGGKSFILRYFHKSSGKDRQLTIGKWPTWSLAAARDKAEDFKRETDGGKDILEERRAERRRPKLGPAMDEYCTQLIDPLASGAQVRSMLERYLVKPVGPKTKLTEIRRSDVRAEVQKLAKKHPRQAALLLSYSKSFFAWAEDAEIIKVNPIASLKPAKVDKAMNNANFVRGRVLDDEELFAFWAEVETVGLHRLTALALKMILVTGQRPGEVAGMHESEINGKVWTIPAARRGKTKTAHVVPLTPLALDLIEQARAEVARLSKRRRGKPAGYIFETRPGSSPAVNSLDRGVKRFAGKLGNKDSKEWGHWTPHDLRRTCRTGLSAAGVGQDIAELTIGHTRKGIAAVYDLHTFDKEKRRALEAWERRLLKITARSGGGNVITATFGI
ncbi:tyrosine-type recombinase/integrase [Parahaliea aestuarii]|uniref:Site-specific integrase n=1 Tax=Parahaliea aestuarii TaxID=1852021 RepID=A0A5C9A7B6_9GAMM|nr:site-specific integrase [Parahaliea aestuarii]TXS95111.1 site-specific integrase [Parahaliea aestuarii]